MTAIYAAIDWMFIYTVLIVAGVFLIMLVNGLRAFVMVVTEWACTFIGLLVGHACVGLYLGYTRAWAIAAPVVSSVVEDEDD